MNVVKNAKKNLAFGVINRLILLLCPFIERTVIQNILGAQYLGLSSLYSSVLSVLSLSELGFSAAMVYNMYKPAAEGNVTKMNALLNFYRKAYYIIGAIIIFVGIAVIPFLPKLIKGTYPSDINLTTLYLIYLSNTAISYFLFAYLSSVIVVHQRDDINSFVNSFVKIFLAVSQITAVYFTHSYYAFAILMPVFTIINNLWIGWRVHRLFPQYKPQGNISGEDTSGIKKLVTGTFIQQACTVTRNSLDSICISAFLGLTLTAIYNNYYLIINGVTVFLRLISTAFMGGVGNHVAMRSVSENYEEMKKLDFVYLWIGGWCSFCLICLYQPFMKLWMGKDMMLSTTSVLLLSLYFYLLKLGDIRSMYSSAKGLWWEQRYRAVGETLLNLILNILMGRAWGVNGIILATMISLFLCNYIWSVGITFRLYFSISKRKNYYYYQSTETAFLFLFGCVTYLICSTVKFDSSILSLITRGIICCMVPNLLMIIVYRNHAAFRYALNMIKRR